MHILVFGNNIIIKNNVFLYIDTKMKTIVYAISSLDARFKKLES